jgi:hypothetical protein
MVGLRGVEVVEDAEGMLPGAPRGAGIARGVLGVAKVGESLGLRREVAEVAVQLQGALVVADGLAVVAELQRGVAKAVPARAQCTATAVFPAPAGPLITAIVTAPVAAAVSLSSIRRVSAASSLARPAKWRTAPGSCRGTTRGGAGWPERRTSTGTMVPGFLLDGLGVVVGEDVCDRLVAELNPRPDSPVGHLDTAAAAAYTRERTRRQRARGSPQQAWRWLHCWRSRRPDTW